MTPTNMPTMPPGPADADALAFARALAAEQDTGPVALPGSVRLARMPGPPKFERVPPKGFRVLP